MVNDTQNTPQFMRIDEVVGITAMSKTTIYRWSRQGQFPPPVKISHISTAWIKSEVDEWVKSKIDARNNGVV